MIRLTGIAGGLACVAGLLTLPGGALAAAPCDAPAHPAGEWRTYGGDLANSRSQAREKKIGAANAGALTRAFLYTAPGTINSTPIVDGGCVFVTSQGASATVGHIAALDATDGTVRWKRDISTGAAAFGGPLPTTPALHSNLVIAALNKQGAPFVVGLDRDTGAEVWRTVVDTQPLTGVNASPVVHDGMVFLGFFGNADAGSKERGGFVVLDATTGELIKKTFVISDAEFEEGFAGAGIWATPAIDPATGFAYVGTSNPHNPQKEHPRSDSILKIDLDRSRSTFGEVVASYKGVSDTFVAGASEQPACETKPDVYYQYSFSATCVALDLDFGSSPNLFADSAGKLRIGELQKSGVYHVVDAQTMAGLAQTPVGAPCFACNAASSAFADGKAFVAAGPPGQMVAVDGTSGLPAWAAPISGGFTYNGVSVANGVVWTVDSAGFLDAFDQSTGRVIAKRSLRDDTGANMVTATTSTGVAIARNTLYAAATKHLIALRPSSATKRSAKSKRKRVQRKRTNHLRRGEHTK